MFSSFSTFSNPFTLPRFLGGNPGPAIDIGPVEVHDVDTQPEQRARTLKHLLKLNHAKHAILFNNMQFHNHMPHVCTSISADAQRLNVFKISDPWVCVSHE